MKRIMLMADALFDARVGTVLQLNPKAGAALLTNPLYRQRDHDNFESLTDGAVTKEEFREGYAKRSTETLRVSPYTNILAFVARLIGLYRDNADTGSEQEALVLVINTWPYEFTRAEIETIFELVNGALEDTIVIEADFVAPVDITPSFLNDGYGGIILYDFESWLSLHKDAFIDGKERCFGMDVLAPRIFQVDASKLSVKEKQQDVLRLRTSLHDFFSVDFLEAKWFSIYDPAIIAQLVIDMAKGDDDGPPILLRDRA